jgi:hypothetical protein
VHIEVGLGFRGFVEGKEDRLEEAVLCMGE